MARKSLSTSASDVIVFHFVRTFLFLPLSRQSVYCPDMSNFALLWGKILDSSLWVKESKETRLVWITMLAMKDQNGIIQASVVGLADRAKVTLDECREALRIFLSPDVDDTSKVEEGRRIREISGGWQIINHELYRYSTEAKREFWRKTKAEQRARDAERREAKKDKRKPAPMASAEPAGARAYNNGNDPLGDSIVTESLPEQCR